jgi:hypothetical protein
MDRRLKQRILTLSTERPCCDCRKTILPGETSIQIHAFNGLIYRHYDGAVCSSNRYGVILNPQEKSHA